MQVPPLCLQQLREAGVSNSRGMLRKQDPRASELLSEFTAGDTAAEDQFPAPADTSAVQATPVADEPASSVNISLLGSIKMPGIKHMFDNISNYVLNRLAWYPTFADACLLAFVVLFCRDTDFCSLVGCLAIMLLDTS